MRFHYVGLEPLNARYTEQLCRQWVPAAFAKACAVTGVACTFADVPPPTVDREIATGAVLDATNRGLVALTQMQALLQRVEYGLVFDGDVIYFQDFWTPGIEALLYSLHLHKIRPRIYARCFAQSVDAYDFTYPMRSWMRPIEIGWSRAMAGVFVASEVHREQLRVAGFECPLHVTGLPFNAMSVPSGPSKEPLVVFSSRLNAEKNPWFMLEVAERFLAAHPHWRWEVTTSAARFNTELMGLLEAAAGLELQTSGRFSMRAGLTKDEYYQTLSRAAVQFNSSLQDYVAFTMLEAAAAGCDLCYPDFRSFPECVHASRRYAAFDVESALGVLSRCVERPARWTDAPTRCTNGLVIEMSIMLLGYARSEVSVWQQPAVAFDALGLL